MFASRKPCLALHTDRSDHYFDSYVKGQQCDVVEYLERHLQTLAEGAQIAPEVFIGHHDTLVSSRMHHLHLCLFTGAPQLHFSSHSHLSLAMTSRPHVCSYILFSNSLAHSVAGLTRALFVNLLQRHCEGCHDQTYPTNEPFVILRLPVAVEIGSDAANTRHLSNIFECLDGTMKSPAAAFCQTCPPTQSQQSTKHLTLLTVPPQVLTFQLLRFNNHEHKLDHMVGTRAIHNLTE